MTANNQTNTKTYYIVTRAPFIGLSGKVERWNPDIFKTKEDAERHIEVMTCDGKIDRDEYTITTRTVTV